MRLGVRCVSVYAFAIENFKRSQEEVDALMTLAETKLAEMSRHGYAICARCLVNIDRFLEATCWIGMV